MWLGERHALPGGTGAGVGQVTVGGGRTAVFTDYERRNATFFAPGGYFWVPKVGQSMMVIKNGEHEVCCLDREVTQLPQGLEEGEVHICSGGASITLKNDGRILVSGEIHLDGRLVVNGNEIG